jgi:hypothetical protein
MNPNLKVTHGRAYIDKVVLTAFDLLYGVKFRRRLRVVMDFFRKCMNTSRK